MIRYDVINKIISSHKFTRYLEIGIEEGNCFRQVNCAEKTGVDPECALDFVIKLTSDNFFLNYTGPQFDVVFIDGLHHADQVIKDIENALCCLNPIGYIVVHDTLPYRKIHQKVPRSSSVWTGDVWKAIHYLRTKKTDLEIFTLDCDYGCTVIRKGKQDLLSYEGEPLTWDYFLRNKVEFLNIKRPYYLDEYLSAKIAKTA